MLPKHSRFGPLEEGPAHTREIVMGMDEFETIRLIDFEGLTQAECAERMEVARTTVQGIYAAARWKLADSLVNGVRLLIEGGDCQADGTARSNGRHGGRRQRGRGRS